VDLTVPACGCYFGPSSYDKLFAMSWLRWSYRIGFLIAGIAAMVWVVAPRIAGYFGSPQVSPRWSKHLIDDGEISLTVLISGMTCLVTTIASPGG